MEQNHFISPIYILLNREKHNSLSTENRSILYWSFLLVMVFFVITLPYSTILNSTSIIVLIVIKIFAFGINRKIDIPTANRRLFVLCMLIFLMYSLSLVWSEDLTLGVKLLENRLSWIAFPLIFLTTPLSLKRNHQHFVLWVFALNILAAAVYTHLFVYDDMLLRGFPLSKWSSWWYTSKNLSGIIGMHPTYMAIYVSTASTIIIYFLSHFKSRFLIKIFLLLGLIYLLIYSLLLSSRLNMLFLAIIMVYFALRELNRLIKNKWLLSGIIIVIPILFLLTINEMPYLKSKFNQSINYLSFNKQLDLKEDSSTKLHFNSWKCSIELMKSSSALLGYGLGDVENVLSMCYYENNLKTNFKNKFNAHNAFFEMVLNIGLLGLGVFLLIIKESLSKKEFLLNWFLAILLIAFISESILSRQKGIVFFVFFINFLNTYELVKKKKNLHLLGQEI